MNVKVTELPLMVPVNGQRLTERVSPGAVPDIRSSVSVPSRCPEDVACHWMTSAEEAPVAR